MASLHQPLASIALLLLVSLLLAGSGGAVPLADLTEAMCGSAAGEGDPITLRVVQSTTRIYTSADQSTFLDLNSRVYEYDGVATIPGPLIRMKPGVLCEVRLQLWWQLCVEESRGLNNNCLFCVSRLLLTTSYQLPLLRTVVQSLISLLF